MWPQKVKDELPALFLGITGIDEEFRNREEYADPGLYETRLAQLADALGNVMTDFGGRGRPFTNVFPIRYPGTWDTNERQREEAGADKWDHAHKAFLNARMVQRYVHDADRKWKAAMQDNDGCLSVISEGWREVTTALRKQNQLEASVDDVYRRLLALSRGWVVNADSNVDRQQRLKLAEKVMTWLTDNPQAVYDRVKALETSLGFDEGDQWVLSDFADMPTRAGVGRPDSLDRRFPRQVQEFLHEWATTQVGRNWEDYTAEHPEGGPWLHSEDISQLAKYMRDYLCSENAFDQINQQMLKVVGLKLRDESAKRRARRKYIRIMLNDFVMNPGPTGEPLVDEVKDDDEEEFGLMGSFIVRWRGRLAEALASGAGAEIRIPPGNDELIDTLEPYGGTGEVV